MSIRYLLSLWLAVAVCSPAQAGDCGPWPAGVTVRVAAGKALSWKGDFNRDGTEDVLELVSVAPGFAPPPEVALANPWDRKPAAVPPEGEPMALAVTHGAKDGACRRFLLVHRDFFATPLWSAFANGEPEASAVAIAAAGSRAHADWKRTVRSLRGDGIVLGTEAGIDILLYWKEKRYAIFWPDEEP
ncbi:MAG TPA: hypothetical protein VI457_11530 [Methylococcaceae bacterium]|nr:hypothetical protein [Methylococcaceae bacterium]